MESLMSYAKAKGAKAMSKVVGPNGAFISIVLKDDSKLTLPVGKRSQAGTLNEYNVLVTDDGNHIATVNHYETAETITF